MFSAAIKSGNAAVATDPQFKYVTMLLHGDGTNGAQNNTFLDSSSNAFSITRNGNTTQGTFSPYGANWSNYFNGSSGNYLSWSGTALGSGNFTVECWVNFQTLSSNRVVIGSNNSGGSGGWEIFAQSSTGKFIFYSNGAETISGSIGYVVGAWTHVAAVRNGSTLTLYVNGASAGSATFTSNLSETAFYVANDQYGQVPDAYISNVRHVVGTAIYTSSFTPSTVPLTAVSGTTVLTCQSNRFIDNSSNAFTITVNGSPSVQRFSPFAPTSAYSTSVIGGSGYFDGSGDTVSYTPGSSKDLGSGDFCIEFWVYANSWTSTTSYSIAQFYSPVDVGYGLSDAFSISSDPTFAGALILYNWGGGSSDGPVVSYALSNLATKTWYHIAFTRSSGTTRMFVNGVQVSSSTKTYLGNFGSNPLYIGGGPGNGWFNGYLSDFRVVKGNAVYTSGFTVPTAPISAISGTVVMLNMTNAGILDNAEMNDLETVGNAQISTSVKKYGTGSLSINGNIDSWLAGRATPNLAMGAGDFTIECWVYTSDTSSYQTLFNSGDYSYPQPWMYVQGGRAHIKVAGSTADGPASSIIANTWIHVAAVRYNGTLKMYVNGVGGTGVSSTDTCTCEYIRVGGDGNGYKLYGYIDDLRITKGYARYTANFTPPTAAFPNQ